MTENELDVIDDFLDSPSELNTSLIENFWLSSACIFAQYYVKIIFHYLPTLWIDLDFQSKLLFALITWLIINLTGIVIAWNKYGDKLAKLLLKDDGDLSKDELNSQRILVEDTLHYQFNKFLNKVHKE